MKAVKKVTQKVGANIGVITTILLTGDTLSTYNYSSCLFVCSSQSNCVVDDKHNIFTIIIKTNHNVITRDLLCTPNNFVRL
jgi:hypothetical protein